MKDLRIPFSLFDFFAVLFPGALAIFGLYLFINPSLTQTGHDTAFSEIILLRSIGDLSLITILVIGSYLLGQVLNALSEVLIDRPANMFFKAHVDHDLDHHNVKTAVRKIFGEDIYKQSNRRTFIMIEAMVGTNMADMAATAKIFIALAVMFQSLALTLLLIMAALIRGYALHSTFCSSIVNFILLIVFILILVILMLWSYRRYKRMWSQTICMSFVAWVFQKSASKPTKAPAIQRMQRG